MNLAVEDDDDEVVPEDDDDDPVEAPADEVVVLREAEELAELSFGLTEVVEAEAAVDTEAGVFKFNEGNTGGAAEEAELAAGVAGVDPTGVDDVEANLVPDADPDHFSYFSSKALRRSSRDILAGSTTAAGLTIEAAADEVEPVEAEGAEPSVFVLETVVDEDDDVAAGSSSRSESEMSSISFIIRELLCCITVVGTDLGVGNFLVPNLGS